MALSNLSGWNKKAMEKCKKTTKQYFAFQWHITDDCDQRCKHCYIFSENNCKKPDAMSWEQMEKVVANCEDFCEVYNRLRSYGCQKYQLSIDGMRETHDWFRKPGSFDITLEKISCLKKAGIRAVIMTTVSGKNIREVPDIIDTVVAHKADVFAFARYCPTCEETGMTPMEYRELLAVCDKKFKEYEAAGCETYFNKKDHLWTLYEYETGEQMCLRIDWRMYGFAKWSNSVTMINSRNAPNVS